MKKQIKLTLKERALLPDLLPQASNKLKQIITKSIISKIEFKMDEIAEHEIKFVQNGITWKKASETTEFEYDLEETEVSLLKDASTDADKSNKVTQQNLSLVIKIDEL